MSNQYGLDFLKPQHQLDGSGGSSSSAVPATNKGMDDRNVTLTEVSAESVAHKPDLEKQADILRFLKNHRSAGYLPPQIIYRGTGIDLDETDESVALLLTKNPKISIEQVPDPENPQIMLSTYAYQSKYNHVRDGATLLAQINRAKYGIVEKDLNDCYDGVQQDIQNLIRAGQIIALNNTEDKTLVCFPRGEDFLIELDGIVTIDPAKASNGESAIIATTPDMTDDDVVRQAMEQNKKELIVCLDLDMDPRKQVRRGEAVCVGGEWFRISSAVRRGVTLEEQPARAQAPLSVTSVEDLSKKNLAEGYVRPFDKKTLPIDMPLSDVARDHLQQASEARKRLHKLVGGRGHSTGATSQLLSNLAHSANPTTLANSLQSGGAAGRKRPTSSMLQNTTSSSSSHKQTIVDPVNHKAAQTAASDPNLALYTHVRRHGCTKDVREMFLETRAMVPTDEMELYNLLVDKKLLGKGEAWRRPKLTKKPDVDNDGKKKKRRYYERKGQRMTNTHLQGTAIGALLADASEKQKQGKSVGDGGM